MLFSLYAQSVNYDVLLMLGNIHVKEWQGKVQVVRISFPWIFHTTGRKIDTLKALLT